MVQMLALALYLCFVLVTAMSTKIGEEKGIVCEENLVCLYQRAQNGANQLQDWCSTKPVRAHGVKGTRLGGLNNICSNFSICKSFNDSLCAGCPDSLICRPPDDSSFMDISDNDRDACPNSIGCKVFRDMPHDVVVRFANLTDLQQHSPDFIVSDSAILDLSGTSKQQPVTWTRFGEIFFQGVVVVVDGLHDVGKLFFSSRLFGLNLPRGMVQHTEGFSTKTFFHRFYDYIGIALQTVGEEMVSRIANRFITVIDPLSSNDRISIIGRQYSIDDCDSRCRELN
jgi:hypothetical protein